MKRDTVFMELVINMDEIDIGLVVMFISNVMNDISKIFQRSEKSDAIHLMQFDGNNNS